MWNFEHESLSSFSFSFRTIWTRVPSNSRRVFVDWDVLTRGRTVIDSSPIVNFGRMQNSHSSFPFPFVVLAKNEAWRAKKCVQSHSMPDIDARNLSFVAFFFDVLPWFDVGKGKKEKRKTIRDFKRSEQITNLSKEKEKSCWKFRRNCQTTSIIDLKQRSAIYTGIWIWIWISSIEN